jgi:hypothetical protein
MTQAGDVADHEAGARRIPLWELGGVPLCVLCMGFTIFVLVYNGHSAYDASHHGIKGTVTIDTCTKEPDEGTECRGSFDSADETVHIDNVRFLPDESAGRQAEAWIRSASSRQAYDAAGVQGRVLRHFIWAAIITVLTLAGCVVWG